MLILGITNNDVAGACLVKGQEIVAAVSEERFNRKKNYKGWPSKSVDFVLSEAHVTLSEIDRIAYGWSSGFNPEIHLDLYLDRSTEFDERMQVQFNIFKDRVKAERQNDKVCREEMHCWVNDNHLWDKFVQIDHHDCHAYGAYCTSSFENALVVTCDARGDFQSLTISSFIDGERRVLHRETSSDSLGYFYGRITNLLGYTANHHEGKVTALSGFGKPTAAKELMKEMINLEEKGIRASLGKYFVPYYDKISEELFALVKTYNREDIAYAAQTHLEEILAKIINKFAVKTGLRNLCLAGGVFSNVKLNRSLADLKAIDEIFVLPCMGDGGLALSAAVAIPYLEEGKFSNLNTMKLGPEFPDFEPIPYLRLLNQHNIKVEYIDNKSALIEEMFDAVKSGQIIGLFRGRAEFGPRALCNRSIICRPDIPNIERVLNSRLNRPDFMPFSPVVNEDAASNCFYFWQPSQKCTKYMTRIYEVKDFFRERCPGATHVDGGARPQIIDNNDDEILFILLKKLIKEVGIPGLINTSFNKHEEPIVNTPTDAIEGLIYGQIDILFINDKWKLNIPAIIGSGNDNY